MAVLRLVRITTGPAGTDEMFTGHAALVASALRVPAGIPLRLTAGLHFAGTSCDFASASRRGPSGRVGLVIGTAAEAEEERALACSRKTA